MARFQEIFVVLPLIQEFLGWLPCIDLERTHRNAIPADTMDRLRRQIRQCQPDAALPPTLGFQDLVRELWRLTIQPLLRQRFIGPFYNDLTLVILRYGSNDAWNPGQGHPVARGELQLLCFDLCCRNVVDILRDHGCHWERHRYVTKTVTGGVATRTMEVTQLHCVVGGGFEVVIRRELRRVATPATVAA